MSKKNTGIVYTLTARCQDCYRCLRICPVNAIGVKDGQAYIDDDKCIQCGTCIKECPQNAKTYRKNLNVAQQLVMDDCTVAVSIAPSFAARYPGWKATRLPSILKKLGFDYVSETSDGAELTAKATVEKAKYQRMGGVCTACPAIVNYTEKYRPDRLDMLVKVVSPMIAHARLIKKKRGNDCKVVFIGPCVAKKGEAQRPEYKGIIDAALTFEELDEWIESEKLDFKNMPESGFESYGDSTEARLFPLPGGMLKTAGIENDGTLINVLHTSGADSVMEIFDLPDSEWKFSLIEPLFCKEGCINGPGMNSKENLFKRRNDVINYAQERKPLKVKTETQGISLYTEFKASKYDFSQKYDEADILKVFAETGKASEELQLNCGACGFGSCREMAKAVIDGAAENDMCMPYMRRTAESRKDMIIETSPNGIVILNEKMEITAMNPAFLEFFLCSDAILGRKISYLMDDVGFEKIASGSTSKFESVMEFNNHEYHQLVYKLEDDNQYVGIFSDISNIKLNENILEGLRKQTAEKAEALLEHQLEMAEKMAVFLGDSTARSEELLDKLMGKGND